MADALLLSRYVGLRVVDARGDTVGRLRDLTVRLEPSHPQVQRVLLGRRRGPRYLLPWSALVGSGEDGVRLSADPAAFVVPDGGPELAATELLLARDVLDTQIIDTAGYRVSRVGDVLLERTGDGRLETVAVEVGARPVLRRLRLSWPASRMREDAVDWADLHLTSSRGHVVQLRTKAAAMHRLDAAGLAELLTRLDVSSAVDVVATVDEETASAAMSQVHDDVARHLRRAMQRPARRRRGRLRRLEGWRVNRPRRPRGQGVR